MPLHPEHPSAAAGLPRSSADARRFSLELALLAAVALAAEWTLRGSAGAFDVHPHPYWLFVLPLAATRGLAAGLMSATAAAVFYLGRHPSFGVDGVQTAETWMSLREPLLFFVVGSGVGLARDGLARTNDALRARLDETEEALARALASSERAPRPAAQARANESVAETESARADNERLFRIAVDMITERCELPGCVLLVGDDKSMELGTFSPDGDPGDRFTTLCESSLVRRAKRQGVALTRADASSDDPVACVAPLFDDTGFLRALVCLESREAVGAEVAGDFFGIAEWASAGFARIRSGSTALDQSVAGRLLSFPRRWLGSSDDLDERLHTEFERFVRHDVPMSVIAIQATRLDRHDAPGARRAGPLSARHRWGPVCA